MKVHCARNPESLAKHALNAALIGSRDNMKAAKPQRTLEVPTKGCHKLELEARAQCAGVSGIPEVNSASERRCHSQLLASFGQASWTTDDRHRKRTNSKAFPAASRIPVVACWKRSTRSNSEVPGVPGALGASSQEACRDAAKSAAVGSESSGQT